MEKNILERFSQRVTILAGSSFSFMLSFMIIIIWLLIGPIFNFSDTWQLAINTGTTIITFLMVFLIQRSQNKESMSIQLKLNELIAAVSGASNNLIDIEDLSEKELNILHKHYVMLSHMAKEYKNIKSSHSVEEAVSRHIVKHQKTSN